MGIFSNAFLIRLLIACLLYFLFNAVIDTVVSEATANRMFKIILLVICVAIVFVGSFLNI